MTYNSKDKLNAFHLSGSVGVAALLGAMTGSWGLFVVVSAVLVGTSLLTGEIRLPNKNKKS